MNVLHTFSHDCMKEAIESRRSNWGILKAFGFHTTTIKWKTPIAVEVYTYSAMEYDRTPRLSLTQRDEIIARSVKSFSYELNIAMNLLQECAEDNYIDIDPEIISKIRYMTRLTKKRYIHDILWQSFHLKMKK